MTGKGWPHGAAANVDYIVLAAFNDARFFPSIKGLRDYSRLFKLVPQVKKIVCVQKGNACVPWTERESERSSGGSDEQKGAMIKMQTVPYNEAGLRLEHLISLLHSERALKAKQPREAKNSPGAL